MMGIRIETTGMPKIPKKTIREYIRRSYAGIGKGWHRKFRPLHFTPRGARAYNYRARKTKDIFTGTVRRRGKHPRAPSGNPLTWSGTSKALSGRRTIRLIRHGVRVSSPVNAFNFRPPGNPRLDMRAEYTRVLPREVRNLERTEQKRLQARFRTSRVRTVVRIGKV